MQLPGFIDEGNHLRWASEVWQGAMAVSTGERQTVVDLLRSIVPPLPCGVVAWARGECVDGRGDLKWTLCIGSQVGIVEQDSSPRYFMPLRPGHFSMNGWRLPTSCGGVRRGDDGGGVSICDSFTNPKGL